MNANCLSAELNLHDLRSTDSVWARSYWFSYAYYVSPALLAEQEAPLP